MAEEPLAQSVVFAERRSSIPADILAPLRPHIAGPHAALRRYPEEKALSLLGDYVAGADTVYNWPNRPTGSKVDLDYIEVAVEDAWLQYYQDLIGSGVTVAPVAGRPDQIKINISASLKANGTSYPRLTTLRDRDVKVNDGVIVRLGSEVLKTYVAGLVPDVTASSVAAASVASTNAVTTPSPPAAAPTLAAQGGGATGGSLAAGTYQIRFGYYGAFGETWSSAAASVTVDGDDIPRVTFGAIPAGASGVRVYVSNVNGTSATCRLYNSYTAGTFADLSAAHTGTGVLFVEKASQVGGTLNGVTATDASLAAYHGEAAGNLTETYTIAVTQASTGGDLTTGRLRVTTASGKDDVSSVTPSATGVATAIGARGLTVTWTRASGDFVIGQSWKVTVRQPWTPVTPTSAGTYTGPTNQTYVVTVTRGGAFTDPTKPQVAAVSNSGGDASAVTDVTASGGAVGVGSYGVTIAFTGTALRAGDQYTIAALAGVPSNYKTIVLGQNLTSGMQAASDLDVFLAIRNPALVLPQKKPDSAPNLNWSATADQITIKSGASAYDPTYTDGGSLVALPVTQGKAYVTYRAWLGTLAGRVTSVSTIGDVSRVFGAGYDEPDNPLAYAAYKAVQNSDGQAVRLTAIADPDSLDEWQSCLDLVRGEKDYHGLVPLTRDSAVLAAYQAHVQAFADDEARGEWRVAWFNLAVVDAALLVNSSRTTDSQPAMATTADDPTAAGTQYTLVVCTTANGQFVTNGVQGGDLFRYLYTVDAYGKVAYQEFPILKVVNEDTLVLATGTSGAVATPQAFEIWRPLGPAAVVNNLVAQLTGTALNKRCRFVWPDTILDDKFRPVAGYHLCAALAAFSGAIAPQQGMRNVALSGFYAAPRSNQYFNNGQLRKLGEAGFFVVTSTDPPNQSATPVAAPAAGTLGAAPVKPSTPVRQGPTVAVSRFTLPEIITITGTIIPAIIAGKAAAKPKVYTRYANTPDVTEVETREEVMVRLDDAIRQLFYQRVAKNFGNATVSDESLVVFEADANAAAQYGIGSTRVDRIGRMMTSAQVAVRRHATQVDRLVVESTVGRGFPANDSDVVIEF
jgi:hypothetical protein